MGSLMTSSSSAGLIQISEFPEPCCIYPKYSDTSMPCRTSSKILDNLLPDTVSKIAGGVANSVDPDEMSHSAASQLGLHSLLRPVCPNT